MLRSASPLRGGTSTVRIVSVQDDAAAERPDRLAAEEPLEVRASGPGQAPRSVAVTMRTPGHDFELAVGFLFTEGLVAGRDRVRGVSYCRDLPADEQRFNVVTVRLSAPLDETAPRRNFFAASSCGVCGKASLEDIRVRCAPLPDGPVVARSALLAMPDGLREAQRVFDSTGGLHAAGLFRTDGSPHVVREDIGRHNAVDKLAGHALMARRVPLSDSVLFVSGRVGFEIVQKAAVAGVPILAAVSAPSSLAVEAARELGMTLVGFVRGSGFNVYSGRDRVDLRR